MTHQEAADQAEHIALQRYLEMRALWSPAWGVRSRPARRRMGRRADPAGPQVTNG